jgi:hypothetical protein
VDWTVCFCVCVCVSFWLRVPPERWNGSCEILGQGPAIAWDEVGLGVLKYLADAHNTPGSFDYRFGGHGGWFEESIVV